MAGIDGGRRDPDAGNAQVDPYRACLGARARRARRAGAALYERSPVARIAGTRDGVDVDLDAGGSRADWAIVATGYATPEFKPLAGALPHDEHLRDRDAAAAGAAKRARIGLGDVMLWDTERPYHYLRWTPDHRLLFGGARSPALPRATAPRRAARAGGRAAAPT